MASGDWGIDRDSRAYRPGWIRIATLIFLLIVSAFAAQEIFTPSHATSTPGDFVTSDGGDLMLDGIPFRFTGLNIPNANSDGTCFAPIDVGQALADIGPGKAVMRAWFFQNMATTGGVRDWSRFDATLSAAAANGVKVIPVLANQWADCETGLGFKTKAWYETGYRHQTDPDGTVAYYDWVREIVTRYKDDPTIAFWQLINEGEIQEVEGGGCASIADAADTFKDWAADVSSLIKSIDTNHLVSLGTIGGGQCGAQGDEYTFVHDLSTIDLCEYHDYGSPSVPIPGDQYNGLQVRFNQCAELGKPIFVGEAGIIPNDVGGTFQARADAFAAKIDAQFAAGSDGFLAWAFIGSGSTLDNYDIGPSDPTLDSLSDSDGDGVFDDDCPGTVLPDVPTEGLRGARFAAQADGVFASGISSLSGLYTLADTRGCSGTQIIAKMGLGQGHTRFGISKSALEAFISS